jgi:hypothetical protein
MTITKQQRERVRAILCAHGTREPDAALRAVTAALRQAPVRTGRPPLLRDEAVLWLRLILKDGAMPVSKILALGKNEGYSPNTLRRAAETIPVVKAHRNWELPQPAQKST